MRSTDGHALLQVSAYFASPHKFSPVPYFLLCRAIELELESRHLQGKRQLEVKRAYGHHLPRRTLRRRQRVSDSLEVSLRTSRRSIIEG